MVWRSRRPWCQALSASAEVAASLAGILDAWIDFDGNGSWADAGEKIFDGEALSAGVNNLTFSVPGTLATEVIARFRLSSGGGLGFDGSAPDGEVEDYRILVDDVAPLVALIGSAPDTGDGQLHSCETGTSRDR